MELEQNRSIVTKVAERLRGYLGGVASIGEGMSTFDMFGQGESEPVEVRTIEQAWQKVGNTMRSVMGSR
jgi:hypothetical protein